MALMLTRRTLFPLIAISAVTIGSASHARNASSGQNNGRSGNNGADRNNSTGNTGGNANVGRAASSTQGNRATNADIRVVHRNGIREMIVSGQYEMLDAQGRRIIRRRAGKKDVDRLRFLATH